VHVTNMGAAANVIRRAKQRRGARSVGSKKRPRAGQRSEEAAWRTVWVKKVKAQATENAPRWQAKGRKHGRTTGCAFIEQVERTCR